MLHKLTASLAALTALVHVVVGGSDALAPTLDAGLPAPAEGAMHAVWHMVSAFLIWSAVVFWRGGEAAKQFALIWCASGLIFIYVGLDQSGLQGLITNPQWTILLVTGAVALLAEWSNSRLSRPHA